MFSFQSWRNDVVAFFRLLLFLLGWKKARLCVQGLVPKSVPAHRGILHHGPISFGIFCSYWNPFAALAKSATQCTIWCRRLSHFLFMFVFLLFICACWCCFILFISSTCWFIFFSKQMCDCYPASPPTVSRHVGPINGPH